MVCNMRREHQVDDGMKCTMILFFHVDIAQASLKVVY